MLTVLKEEKIPSYHKVTHISSVNRWVPLNPTKHRNDNTYYDVTVERNEKTYDTRRNPL